MSKKLNKEAFVQGHSGTSLFEITSIASAPAVLLLIVQILSYSRNPRRNTIDVIFQFLWLVLPLVAQMLGPLSAIGVLGVVSSIALILIALNFQLLKRERSKVPILAMRQALSSHRGSVMLITCIAILAVDFHAFPRRFAKAETFGTGLMDAGVGSIVAASAFACGMKDAASATISRTRSSAALGRRRRDIIRLGILAALGLGRALITAAISYQNPVGEYGKHWNFFLTLAAIRGLTLFIPRAAAGSPLTAGILGIGVLVAHQALLSFSGVTEYIHSATRGSDLISANKEGIFSLPGYFALHLLGCACGAQLEETVGPSSHLRAGQRTRVGIIVGILWSAFFAVRFLIEPVSRRTCNASYVLWMLALNAQSLALLAAVAAALPTQPLPKLLQAVNDTMLPTFLVANVLTGVVNIAIDTMQVGDWSARLIVIVYMAIVSIAALIGQRLLRDERQGVYRR